MKQSILHVLRYFEIFNYPPTTEEVYTFLNKKIQKREFYIALNALQREGIIYQKNDRVTLHKIHVAIFKKKQIQSQHILTQALPYIVLLRFVPTIQFIGISGSLSMENSSRDGDIDLFLITTANTIWITRCIVLLYKYAVRIINKNVGSKLCFNMFFSVNGLHIYPYKQNEYIAHELLQLKPVINKKDIYKVLLYQNKWIQQLLPNIIINRSIVPNKLSPQFGFFSYVDSTLQKLQTFWLHRNGYTWRYKNNQLWLIQQDFEENIMTKIKMS